MSPQHRRDESDTDAEFAAVLAASRSSAAEEEARRAREEAEELRRLTEADEEERRRQQQRVQEEERQLQAVMEQSRLEEEKRVREARDSEEQALRESRLEAEREQDRRRREEDEEIRRVMVESLREEWERRREAEQAEIRMVEVARREIEERRRREREGSAGIGHDGNAVAGSSRGHGTIEGKQREAGNGGVGPSRRPLPTLPRSEHGDGDDDQETHERDDHGTSPSPRDSPPHESSNAESAGAPNPDPFSDQAEAPPDYDSVHSDRPPAAPSRAPTGVWARARQSAAHTQTQQQGSSGPYVDPIEEKRRMEAAGGRSGGGDTLNAPTGAFHIANPSLSAATTRPSTPAPRDAAATAATGRRPLPAAPAAGSEEHQRQQRGTPPSASSLPTPQPSPSASTSSPTQSHKDSQGDDDASDSIDTPATSLMTGDAVVDADAANGADSLHLLAAPQAPRCVSSSATVASSVASGQRTPLGIDWGYSSVAFGTDLSSGGDREDASTNTDDAAGPDCKARFPSTITLASGSSAFFTVRCGSWRLLLRALAWLGNTRVEAGPSEVAAAAADTPRMLRLEVEFVTPSISSTGFRRTSASSLLAPEHYGVGDYPQGATLQEIVRRAEERLNGRGGDGGLAACVSLCISLTAVIATTRPSPSSSASASASSAERELDMSYLKRGSTRKVLHLPPSSMGLSPVSARSSSYASRVKSGFDLPCTLITLAQHLQQAHRFSAACPTSGYTARHTPRDLYHIIDAHDERFVKKLQAESGSSGGALSSASALVATIAGCPILLWDPAPPSATTTGGEGTDAASSPGGGLPSSSSSSLPFEYYHPGAAAAEDEPDHIARRVKNKVKKKWRGRQGEVEDGTEEELRNWITPLDLSDVG